MKGRDLLSPHRPQSWGVPTQGLLPRSDGFFACSAGNFWARGDFLGLCKMPPGRTVEVAAAIATRSDPHAWCGFVLVWEDSRANQVVIVRVFAAPRLCCCSQILYSPCFWEGVGWDCCKPACSALFLPLSAVARCEETSQSVSQMQPAPLETIPAREILSYP